MGSSRSNNDAAHTGSRHARQESVSQKRNDDKVEKKRNTTTSWELSRCDVTEDIVRCEKVPIKIKPRARWGDLIRRIGFSIGNLFFDIETCAAFDCNRFGVEVEMWKITNFTSLICHFAGSGVAWFCSLRALDIFCWRASTGLLRRVDQDNFLGMKSIRKTLEKTIFHTFHVFVLPAWIVARLTRFVHSKLFGRSNFTLIDPTAQITD